MAGTVLLLSGALCFASRCLGYSVLTHEAIIDAQWDDHIQPLLLKRFPNATPEQLREAHAYAYGGCVIQDMGYYPFGSRFFSHLTHYVRSGDFVEALFEESRDINDYAFALGALSHYSADVEGHSIAVNRSVALLYPRLHRRYGDWITWEDSRWAHALTEFGFDTLEVVARHDAPQAYRDWIGFRVPKPVLQRAFKKTYGLDLSDEILDVDLSIAAYRKLANKFIPEMSEVAWALRRKQLEERASSAQHAQLYHLSRESYRDWRKYYTRPGVGDKVTAFFFRLLPKFGPLSAFDFHAPTLQTEQLFGSSLKATVASYNAELSAVQVGRCDPPDVDLDTGQPTRPGEYFYCDRTYARLLHDLKRKHFAGVSAGLRDNLLSFYADSADNSLRRQSGTWRRVTRDLAEFKAACPLPESQTSLAANVCQPASSAP
ncbi:MAG TPA: zinc dependent phospholipase C family protein [Terriglobia bacterium]|nr:zinc dependent phospholipase C family protein [Terriglobia bacterium]